MGDHRHATDQQQTFLLASCPEDCQQFEFETSGDPDAIDELVATVLEAYDECPECGGEFSYVRRDEPLEVLD